MFSAWRYKSCGDALENNCIQRQFEMNRAHLSVSLQATSQHPAIPQYGLAIPTNANATTSSHARFRLFSQSDHAYLSLLVHVQAEKWVQN